MKSLRVLLLVVLAVLLPLRGAQAGSVHCAEGPGEAARAIVASHVHSEAHTPGDPHSVAGDAVHALHHASSPDDGQSSASANPCNLCAATCSGTPFMSEPLSVVPPVATAGTSFPALVAPPPRHAAEGPERPPRSA